MLQFVYMYIPQKGKLIVFEGIDGSGKTTQLELLAEKLSSHGIPIKKLKFPELTESSFGKQIKQLNDGIFGEPLSQAPELVSLLYAMNRWDHIETIERLLSLNYIVLVDRYVGSNIAYQGHRPENEERRQALISDIYELEYKKLQIVKPDTVMFINTPPAIAHELLNSKDNVTELDTKLDYQEKAYDVYTSILNTYDYWQNIRTTDDETLLSRELIHDVIWQRTQQVLNAHF